MLHASHKTNKITYESFYFKICFVKKFRSTFKENINQFFGLKKKIRFVSKEDKYQFFVKKFRFVSNEDTNQFFVKKFIFVSNEDTNLFFD